MFSSIWVSLDLIFRVFLIENRSVAPEKPYDNRVHLFLIVIIAAVLARQYSSAANAKAMEIDGSKVQKIENPKKWEERTIAADGKVVVVDFFATWCGPCVRAAPVFAQYSIDMENDPIEFWKVDVDSASGDITFKASPNYETKNSYSLSLTATDGSDATDTQALTVTVTDANDSPVFSAATATDSIAENAATSTQIFDANSTDEDAGDTLREYS